ncbi:hypothetical protein SORBI_3003G173332 [Sorghum bicolor]|uniref:CCHC-type domain-containing protein n=1 Tax=Sorghum bicolor TaxID=4558 RepID=A0A1W0VXS6_SORBI|nr:hypothetical protein SORBI_3003G173332 [Sorghum bicolor]
MAAYGLDVECPHIFDGTHFAQWRNWMTCNFKFISPQMWWMVDVGFSHVLDEENVTQAQDKCLHLDYQATNIFYSSMKDNIFGEIMDMKSAHEIWSYLNEKYGPTTKEDDVPKVDAQEDVEHDHNMVVVEDCSTSWSSEDEDDGYESDASTSSSTSSHSSISLGDGKVSIGGVIVDCDDPNFELVCRLTKALRNEMAKTSKLKNKNLFLMTTCEQQKHLLYVTTCSHEELKLVHEELCVTHDNLSSSLGSNDQSHSVTNPCDVGKKHVSTSCDDLLSMPCSSHIDACSTFMFGETNILKENNKLKNEVKNLSNKLERCYNSKVTFEHILKTQRNYVDKCGLGFKKKMTKGERKQEKRMKKLLLKKLSHTMCYRCHEAGHLANGCPNIEKLKKMKEEERLKYVKCFKCRTWGHLTSMCPTKQLVKHQAKPQQKPQVEQEKKPQAQCPTKLEKKALATLKRQGNEKQHMSKEETAQSKRSCYLCRERGHMAYSCPLGNNSKPISIDDFTMLRNDGNGTSMVAIAKHPAIHTKASPKYVAPNLRGPKLVWVPSKSG